LKINMNSKLDIEPGKSALEKAYDRVKPYVHRTPVLTSKSLDSHSGSNLFFKCENFQKVGAFKFRGACNAIFSMEPSALANGVATHSSGNHAQALALAAAMKGVPAFIVMPRTAPSVKKEAVKGYGAKIIECDPTLEAREKSIAVLLEKTGAEYVPPYNDYRIICGQATAALELIEEKAELDAIITPVGGGGLLAGTALAVKYFSPQTKVYAGEPEGADDAYRSLKMGEIVPNESVNTIADGLLTNLGDKNFGIIKKGVEAIFRVSDAEIVSAMKLIWERMKIIIEPSAAVPIAAVLKNKEKFHGKKVGIILSGGNVDLTKLPF